jgi:hypothetical protein
MVTKEELRKQTIKPNGGAAGVNVGATPQLVRAIWGEPRSTVQIKTDHVRWKYEDVSFWIKAGNVDQIGVSGRYEGKTEDGIGIGSTREAVERVYGPLEWDGTWLINRPPFGIGFDFGPSLRGETRVTDIFVFHE